MSDSRDKRGLVEDGDVRVYQTLILAKGEKILGRFGMIDGGESVCLGPTRLGMQSTEQRLDRDLRS
jgi:hypothetical protein